MSAIAVSGLVKRYGDFTAVAGVGFEVTEGQVTALLGPNSAGKTTTIEILEGFQAPTAGTVRVRGADPRTAGRAWRARIGLVLPSTSLDSQLTVTESLQLFGGPYPRPRRVADVLEVIDLAGDARTRIGALSGGQRRRVDLGIAIIGRPEMLFLDEPITGLDPEARRRLWAAIGNLTTEGGTVLLTTHYLDEAQYLASRVIVLAGWPGGRRRHPGRTARDGRRPGNPVPAARVITSVSGANPVLVFTYIPLLIFSGALGNLTLPHWVTTAASYLPVQPVVHAVTRALQHTGGGLALMSPRDLAVLAGWAAGCLLLSMWRFSWDPHRPAHAPRPRPRAAQ